MKHADLIAAITQDPSASGRSALYASWARSMTRYKLDPFENRPPRQLTAQELAEARERMGPLLEAAGCTLDKLFAAVGGAGCCVLLTDSRGVPLERRGHWTDDDMFRRAGLWTGAVWSEEEEGTNGIGTCIAEQRQVTIHRDQHFHLRNTGLSCTTAPIHDHRGRLAATLDVSSCRDDLTDDVARLIASAASDAARRIEARHFRSAFPKARIVLVPDTDWGCAALLAVGADDLIVGATSAARAACGITDAMLERALPAQEILREMEEECEGLSLAERGVVHRALARASGNVSAAAKALGVSRATLHRKMRRLGLARCG